MVTFLAANLFAVQQATAKQAESFGEERSLLNIELKFLFR
ncbi:hypothetical protein ALFP_3389 [Alcaligenes faecalis]|nr:hypothetical protein ALFP_3389 [Alcaligenes faecalis]